MSVIVEELSAEQRRMWFVHQLTGADPAHYEAQGLLFDGKLDSAMLQKALLTVARRHAALRTTFAAVGGQPMQRVHDELVLPFSFLDLEPLALPEREAQKAKVLASALGDAFDLERGPLWRVTLVRLGPAEHLLAIVMHHLICDGDWSFERFLRELVRAYDALTRGAAPALSPLWAQYPDHARRQREWLQGDEPSKEVAYWRTQLASAPPPLELPSDRPRRLVPAFRTESLGFTLSPATVAAIDATALRHDCDRFTVLLAAFNTLAFRVAAQSDILVGTVTSYRADPELEPLIGDFGNLLVLRTPVDGALSFDELLTRQRGVVHAAFDHGRLPFDRLVEALQLRRDAARTPLFNVLLVMRPDALPPFRLGQLTATAVDLPSDSEQFETILAFRQTGSQLTCRIDFDTTLHDRVAMDRLAGHFTALLERLCAEPSRAIGEVEFLSDDERRSVLHAWNETAAEFPRGRCIHELFDQHAARNPDAIALVFGDSRMTYRELQRQSNRLAHRLQRLGIGPDVLVGISMTRSMETIASVMAVWKAGGAFVPLDPGYPRDRLGYMLADSGAPVLLSQRAVIERLPEHSAQTVLVDELWPALDAEPDDPPQSAVTPRNLAYVIYTSGSTGRPKGVMVEHAGVPNMVAAQQQCFGVGPNSHVLQFSSFSFDASVFEIVMALLSGATLVLGTQDQIMPGPDLAHLLEKQAVSVVVLPPSALAHLPNERFPALRTIIVAGEACPPELVHRWGADHEFFNAYGPTETTVWATIQRCHPDGTRPSIGRPIQNTVAYVLDERMAPVPIGAPGELYVGGVGVARGYLNRPELTQQRFVDDPFSGRQGARMYRTGDLVRRRANGELDFLGRIDHQVKVRGFRIELGEIEAVIGAFPGVKEAIVLVRAAHAASGADTSEQSDARVVAYLVPGGSANLDVGALRTHVRDAVPAYMVPSAFVVLPAFPLTPNGKIDRNALPSHDEADGGQQDYVAPRTVVEQQLAEIWSQVLRRQVGIHDDFFAMGGHSLLAAKALAVVREKFGIALPVRLVFEKPTIAALAASIGTVEASCEAPAQRILPVPDRKDFPLSYAQQRIWFVDSIRPGNDAYDCPAAFRLRGTLDIAAFTAAIRLIVARHASLRTTFVQTEEQLIQRVSDKTGVEPHVVDLRDLSPAERESRASTLARDAARYEFDLSMGPLLRVVLLRLASDDQLLVVNMHHIVCDGWSMGIFFQELAEAYRALRSGQQPSLPELPIQYADFSVWQRTFLQDAVVKPQLAFWTSYLAGAPQMLELPTDHPRPSIPSFRGARIDARIGSDVLERLRAISRQEGTSVFMTLLAAFKTLLSRYARTEDVLVGIPTAGRNQRECQGLIGMFANILVVRTDLSGKPTFRELLRRVRGGTFAAFEHQDIPFERLVEELRPTRDLSFNPLVQVALVPQDMPFDAPAFEGLSSEPASLDREAAQFDFVVFTREASDGVLLWAEYTTDLFDRTTMARWLDQFVTLVAEASMRPDCAVASLPLLGPDERRRVTAEWNQTRTDYPREASIPSLFRSHVARSPAAIALDFNDDQVTYAELEQRANRLAHHLRSLALQPGEIVGVALPPSADFVVALLAVLAAGASYVPIDPAYPPERVAFMVRDASIRLLVTRSGLLQHLREPAVQRVCVDTDREVIARQSDQPPPTSVTASSIAYVIYTSGSTGVPKGARIRHRGVVRLVVNTDHLQIGPDDRVAQVANVSFDVAGAEIWGALLNGARLVGVPKDVSLSPEDLAALIERKHLTTMMMTAPLFHQVAALLPTAFRRMRQLLIGGESLDPRAVRRVLEAGPPERLINSYGPAESTVCATWHCVTHVPDDAMRIPIGRPVANTQVYVLDDNLEPLPPGVPGELFVGGDGLADGYLNRPELTAEKFLPHPFGEPGEKVYRTGDLVRCLADGQLEFLGRVDFQVKIRGMRIELGEIEAVLQTCPGIRQCVVVAKELGPGDRRLVAYAVPEQGARVGSCTIRDFLGTRLPEHMVPPYVIVLERLPLTPNMKVDRAALPEPELVRSGASRDPQTPVEQRLARIWREVLEIDQVGANDSFFDVGGHSLLATRVLSRVRREFGVKVTIHQFFESPTIEGLAALIDPDGTWAPVVEELSIVPTSGMSVIPIVHGQRELWRLSRRYPGLAYNLPVAFRIRGPLNPEALDLCIQEIVWRHEPFRAVMRDVGDGEVLQIIAGLTSVTMQRKNLESLPESERDEQAMRMIVQEARRPFDLEQGPMARALLVREAANDHVFLFTMHHIAGDGWSLHILFRELQKLYEGMSLGKPVTLEPLPIQFRDFVVHQLKWLDGEEGQRHLQYWTARLAGAPTSLALPEDHPRPAERRFDGTQRDFLLDPALLERLSEFGQREGATLFMTLLAALYVTLFETTSQTDLVVAATTSGRTRRSTEGLIGCCFNKVALRGDLSGNPTYRELVARVRTMTIDAFDHQDVPFEVVVDRLGLASDGPTPPLAQVGYAPQDASWESLRLQTLELTPVPIDRAMCPLDVILYYQPSGSSVRVWFEYRIDLFEASTIDGLLSRLRRALERMATDPGARLSSPK